MSTRRRSIWTPSPNTDATATWSCAGSCRASTWMPALAALATLAADPGLAPGQRDASGAFIALEPTADPSAATAANRADLIRKFGDFTDASPALLRAAMSVRLHAVLDALMGQGRVLLQEMALVKPPKVSGEKPWHQDAAYFRGSDPNLMFGVWIALDPATRENGCMEVIPGSHLCGPAPHMPARDINLCTIRPDLVRLEDRLALPMAPGRCAGLPPPDWFGKATALSTG